MVSRGLSGVLGNDGVQLRECCWFGGVMMFCGSGWGSGKRVVELGVDGDWAEQLFGCWWLGEMGFGAGKLVFSTVGCLLQHLVGVRRLGGEHGVHGEVLGSAWTR